MTRAVPPWSGKTDDAAIPPRVKLRIFQRENGVCYLSGRKIAPGEPYDFDHKIALVNGGRHCESNLFPALRDKHHEKSKIDVAEKAKTASVAKRHIGAAAPKAEIKNAGFPPSGKPKRERNQLPPRLLYEDKRA